jgi:hypothetical protein
MKVSFMLKPFIRICLLTVLLAMLSGCASFDPNPMATDAFRERKLVKSSDDVTVSIAVPSAQEAAVIFGVDMAKKKIQPIWMEIDNRGKTELLLLPILVDNDYFAPLEVSYKYRNKWSKSKTREKDDFFIGMQMPHYIPPETIVSGYVYGRREAGVRYAKIALLQNEHDPIELAFALPIPGVQADYERVDFDNLYAENELIHIDDL